MPQHGGRLAGGFVDGVPAVMVTVGTGEDDDAELHEFSL
jgi:hypothetical protein